MTMMMTTIIMTTMTTTIVPATVTTLVPLRVAVTTALRDKDPPIRSRRPTEAINLRSCRPAPFRPLHRVRRWAEVVGEAWAAADAEAEAGDNSR